MEILLKNCNNIINGNINIIEGRLNIKYGINGTGKTTISKAITAAVENDNELKKSLIPFRYRKDDRAIEPEITGCERVKSVFVFNERYVEDYVFTPQELLKGSFEIFIKSEGYDKQEQEITNILKELTEIFNNDCTLNHLISLFNEFINGFGKNRSGYSTAGAIAKGIGQGNKIDNIPRGLEKYQNYLKCDKNVIWLKWQLEGKKFLDIDNCCPYCTADVGINEKKNILKIDHEYNSSSVEKLVNMLDVLKHLVPYLTDETASKINDISRNISGITDSDKDYLISVKNQVIQLKQQLDNLKNLGYHRLSILNKIDEELSQYKINLKNYPHLDSELLNKQVHILNSHLDKLLKKAGRLQGEVNKQKKLIKETIDEYSTDINNFLLNAGYKYSVSLEYDESLNYHLVMKHVDCDSNIVSVNECLSYGERNAFALVMFMYSALKMNPDLIILDDPISSFDGNKKFAILNMLFMGKKCFKNRSVLLLTHEFNIVIDAIKNMSHNFNPSPKAYFLSTRNGCLSEQEIEKRNFQTFIEITKACMESNIDNLNKLIYLRRYLEYQGEKMEAYQLISNILHGRESFEWRCENCNRKMLDEEIDKGNKEIRKYIKGFDYIKEVQKARNISDLKKIYNSSICNYDKLQIFRIIFKSNYCDSIVNKFINETYHIENDFLFQLDPHVFDIVPQYILDECDREVSELI